MFLVLRGLSAGLIAVVAVTSTRTVPALVLGNTDNHHDDARAHDRDPKDSGPCRPKRYLPCGVYPPADCKQATDNKGRDASHEPAVYSLAVFSFHLGTSFPFSSVIFYSPWMISSIVEEMVVPGTGTEVLSLPIIGRADDRGLSCFSQTSRHASNLCKSAPPSVCKTAPSNLIGANG
jgi:hypothetical protein